MLGIELQMMIQKRLEQKSIEVWHYASQYQNEACSFKY